MRLIDVDDAIEKINCLCVDDNENWIGTENRSFVDHADVIDILSSIPTVDAVVLPCKLGADVYMIPSKEAFDWSMRSGHAENIRVYHQYIVCITFTERGWHLVANADKAYGTGKVLVDSCYKETWFLTREEAEAALAKMKGGHEV